MSIYAIVSGGVVENLVAWDGASDWSAPEGTEAVAVQPGESVSIGYSYNGTAFIAPAATSPTLAQAQAAQMATLAAAYQTAIAAGVSFTTAAGVTKTFQTDPASIGNMQSMVAAFGAAGVPNGFYWVASDNAQVPFATADLLGLAKTAGLAGWTAFQHLQAQKAAVLAATTVAAVQAIGW